MSKVCITKTSVYEVDVDEEDQQLAKKKAMEVLENSSEENYLSSENITIFVASGTYNELLGIDFEGMLTIKQDKLLYCSIDDRGSILNPINHVEYSKLSDEEKEGWFVSSYSDIFRDADNIKMEKFEVW